MLNNETPSEWKTDCVIFPTEVKKDKFGSEIRKKGTSGTAVSLCWQPVESESIVAEYGLENKDSIQAVLYEPDVRAEPFDIVSLDGKEYEVCGVKKYISYRLIIAKRVNI